MIGRDEILQLIRAEIDASKTKAQYDVPKVPYHIHNNLDSPPVQLPPMDDVLFDYFATVGNGTTVETNLYSDTILPYVLVNNGYKLDAQYAGTFVSSATATRQLKIYFAGTAIFDSGALTLSLSSAWTIYTSIIRVSNTVVRHMTSMTTQGAALAAYTNSGEITGLNLSQTNYILKITGQAAGVGAATNDILASMGWVERKPSA